MQGLAHVSQDLPPRNDTNSRVRASAYGVTAAFRDIRSVELFSRKTAGGRELQRAYPTLWERALHVELATGHAGQRGGATPVR